MSVDPDRAERIIEVIVAATSGDYQQRVPLEDVEDPLLEVEVGINYLLDELALRRDENEAQTQSLREQSEQIKAQAEALITALSTPIIMLWPGVLVLPLIGRVGQERAAKTTTILLDRVISEGASYVILDLTGVESITADTTTSLVHMVRSTMLLGVTCLVTGIHAKTALQFVELDADLRHIRTLARVSDALEVVLKDERVRR